MAAIPKPRSYDPHFNEREWYVDVVPVMYSADALDANDVACATFLIENACKFPDIPVELFQWRVIDYDDNTAINLDLILFNENVVLGTPDSAIDITDAHMAYWLGNTRAVSTSWYDFINAKACLVNEGSAPIGNLINMPIHVIPKAGTRNIYGALVNSGTPTYTASGIHLRLFFRPVSPR